jgi:outer membrane protein
MKHILLITSFFCAFTLTGFAQQAPASHSFSLADCIKYAYEHQDSVKNAALDVKSAEYKIKETIGVGLPQINGSANFQDYFKVPTQVAPGEPFGQPGKLVALSFALKYSSTLALDASQILFDGSFLVGLKASKTYKDLSVRNLDRTKVETNANVTKAYYHVLVSDEQIKLFDANIKQLKEQLDQTVQQNKQGFVEKIDVDRLTVQYNNLVTNRENIIRSLIINYQLLKFQMGMPIEEELELKDKLIDISLGSELTAATTDTTFYHNRVEYKLLETAKKLNEFDLLEKKAKYLPSLSAVGNYSGAFYENKFSNLYNRGFTFSYVGLRLSVPIFSGGQRSNQVKQAQVAVLKAQNNLENAKNGFKLQANSARITYENSVQSLNNQKRSRELAQEVLRVARIKYQQGVGSSIEVTQAQTEVENADNAYIQALYATLVSKVDLDKAYGRIN